MAAKAETLRPPTGAASESSIVLNRPGAVVLPMPRVNSDGYPMIDHAAGGRLGPARGVLVGLGVGLALWAGLLSLAWRVFH